MPRNGRWRIAPARSGSDARQKRACGKQEPRVMAGDHHGDDMDAVSRPFNRTHLAAALWPATG